MQSVIDSVRRRAVMAETVRRQTYAIEHRILESAEDRLSKVEQRIAELKGTAVSNREHGDEYMRLVEERGQLHHVITMSKHHLGGGASSRDSTLTV